MGKKLHLHLPHHATIAIGSEISGGVEDVRAEYITAVNTKSIVRIKTGIGRDAYVEGRPREDDGVAQDDKLVWAAP
ncbi:polygalacturonase [Canna indica]|uniref:Polygalacturonase n=1 Tax=Canna indica TaxID=4628 RepID=A0AAQ3JRH6_9LILI|nr:polygalacturonase [Canna indica]